jgi:Tfp pilus assembly protein PilP
MKNLIAISLLLLTASTAGAQDLDNFFNESRRNQSIRDEHERLERRQREQQVEIDRLRRLEAERQYQQDRSRYNSPLEPYRGGLRRIN